MPPPIAPLFALVDCNNFYASCERVFQPALRGKPVVVLSNNDGCVIARSEEAKALGIAMGAPWHLFREGFARYDVAIRSSNYALYGDMSARVMRVLADAAPAIERYSIDEAFLDLGGLADAEGAARALRATVRQWTGIPVSIGIAPTKVLAKAANRWAKRYPGLGGVALMQTDAAQEAVLGRMALEDLWGVSDRLAARLRAIGIPTPLALRAADPRFVREWLGVVAERLVRELRGQSCLALEDAAPARRSVMVTRCFGRPVTLRREMEEAVATHAARAAEKMRRQGLAAECLSVSILTNKHRTDQVQYAAARTLDLPVATADTGILTRAALRGLDAIWQEGPSYKKAGVVLLGLVPAAAVQNGLFDTADTPARQRLMGAMDRLNARHGRGTVAFAATGGRDRAWGTRFDARSARFTTRVNELLRV